MTDQAYLRAAKWCFAIAVLVSLVFILFGCYHHRSYAPIRLHGGPSVIYADRGNTMVVSEGYVHAAYVRWRRHISMLAAQGRLVMLSVETRLDGAWIIKKSSLWEHD
jgi:hypothetical protein